MARDWLFHTEEGTCNFRCAGVILQNGKVFLQRDGEEYALPGGQVKIGETGSEAVERELCEEFGVKVRCARMLWTEECFWSWKGRLTHTLSFYYLTELCEDDVLPDDGSVVLQRDNPRIQAEWVPFEQLSGLTVYPAFLKEQIMDLKPGHFITRA